MKSIFNQNDYAELMKRIESVQHNAPALWGKMNVAQMFAHCNGAMSVAVGDLVIKRSFIGKLIGKMAKKKFVSDKPLSKGSPTAKEFIMTGTKEFEKEKTQLLTYVKRFHEGGEKGATKHPHSFFGEFTPAEWGETQWKHLDHHLRQFGA